MEKHSMYLFFNYSLKSLLVKNYYNHFYKKFKLKNLINME